jgi:hypothetical protein
MRAAGGGAWSTVLTAGNEYELSVWAANASSASASILWDLGANAPIIQVINGPTPGFYQYYTVNQSELTGTPTPAFGSADYNSWSEATANTSQPVWKQYTYRFRIASAATASARSLVSAPRRIRASPGTAAGVASCAARRTAPRTTDS